MCQALCCDKKRRVLQHPYFYTYMGRCSVLSIESGMTDRGKENDEVYENKILQHGIRRL